MFLLHFAINDRCSLSMCDTHIAKTALKSVVAALVAINFVVVTYRSVTFPSIQRTSFPLGGRPEPKLIGSVDGSQPARQRVNISYMEKRVAEAYSKYDYKKARRNGIANGSLPEGFLFPEGIPDQSTTVLIYVYSSPETGADQGVVGITRSLWLCSIQVSALCRLYLYTGDKLRHCNETIGSAFSG